MSQLSTIVNRLEYLSTRVREMPMHVIGRKAWLRVKPQLLRARYEAQRRNSKAAPVELGAAFWARSSKLSCALLQLTTTGGFADRARLRAAESLAGRFSCLGYGAVQLPQGDAWRSDPFHDATWPEVYFPGCDFLNVGRRSDVKVVWELSRLQWLPWLAEGVLFSSSPGDYLEAFVNTIRDWRAANPVGFGPNWTCAMEVAIRASNVALALAVLAPRMERADALHVAGFLEEHVQFIHEFPEVSDVPGNHYLADLMGIAIVEGLLRPGSELHRQAVEHFTRQAGLQFEADGAHFERTTVYHRLCVDMVAAVIAVSHQSAAEESAGLLPILARGVRFADAVSSEDGLLPIIGDSDSGRVLWFGEDPRRYGAAAELLYALTGSDCRRGLSEDLGGWLCALAGVERPAPAESPPKRPSYAEFSGAAIGRRGALTAVVRVGPQGLKGRAPHDHDDALNIWAFFGADDLLVDEGCHSYTLDPAIRRGYIASTAHNVITPGVAERHALQSGSIFDTVRGAPTANIESFCVDGDETRLTASLETPALSPFVRSVRQVRLFPGGMEIMDEWEWKTARPSCLRWRLAPEWRLARDGASRFIATDSRSGRQLSLDFSFPDGGELQEFNYSFADTYGGGRPGHGVSVLSSSPASQSTAGLRIAVLDEPEEIGRGLRGD